MSDAEDNTKAGDRENKDSKEKSKEDGGHLDNDIPAKTEDGKDDSGKNKDKMTPNKKNTKPKNQKKEESEDEVEDDDDDDDEEEENDTNGKVPLLDQPLQISGTRDRKKVQRFSEEFKPVVKESPKNEIPEGRGTQLGDIAQIESLIQKYTADNLKPLYKVLFNRPGKPALIKRNIRKFNGFDFKEGSDLYAKKRASISRLDMKSLKSISKSLHMGTSGNREELVNRVLDFLMEPKESDRPAPKDSKKKKTASSSSKKTKRKSNSSGKSKKKVDSEDEDESSEEEMEADDKGSSEEEKKASSEEEEEEEEEEEDSEEDKKKKAPKKKSLANSKKPAPKKVDQKKEGENKKAEVKGADNKKKRKEKQPEVKSDDESSEDEPLVKKTKQPPTDDEIKTYVKQILEGANLEEITMKTVCKQVYAAYPEFDLAHKKDFIKTTVKSLIST